MLRPRIVCTSLLLMSSVLAVPAFGCPAENLLTVVVPYAAGGSVDVTTRIVAKAVGHQLGRAVQVSNVPGASGLLAVRRVLAAERDGCTLLAGTLNAAILVPMMNPHAGFVADDLKPVAKVGSTDMVLVASPASGLRDMSGLQRAAAERGARLKAGHPGHESLQAILLDELQRRLRHDFIEVPYSGAAQLVTDLIGGHLDIAVLAKPVALPLIRRGSLNLLSALTQRDGYIDGSWSAWFAAREVPDSALDSTRRPMLAALGDSAVQRALVELGLDVDAGTDRSAFAREVALTAQRLREEVARPDASRNERRP